MNVLIAVFVTFLLLASTEFLWRKGHVQKEYARKIVHMSVGVFVAAWPFFLSWDEIRLLSIAFIVVVSISLKLKFFKSIHSVERPSWGEVLFAAAVGLTTLLTNDPYIYAAAIMHMSLADGAAALLGTKYGQSNGYRVLGQFKSRAGSLAFFSVSLLILAAYVVTTGIYVNTGYVVLLAMFATAVENCGWKGLDNLFVPVLIALVLERLG
jgi:phytol kinase